jgi:hypothetical protein
MSDALEVLTTEHYTLQTARAATIADSNGRVAVFLSAVSSGVVAIAFVGQTSRFGPAFEVFSLVVLVPLAAIGLATYVRVLQLSIQDAVYERGINRIRHFYLEAAPGTRRYFVLSAHDDDAGVSQNVGFDVRRWWMLLTTSGVVAVINGVIVGSIAGLLSRAFRGSLLVDVAVGLIVAIVLIAAQMHYHGTRWLSVESLAPTEFPSAGTPRSFSPQE